MEHWLAHGKDCHCAPTHSSSGCLHNVCARRSRSILCWRNKRLVECHPLIHWVTRKKDAKGEEGLVAKMNEVDGSGRIREGGGNSPSGGYPG